MKKPLGAVAAGHTLTVEAAASVLKEGGNAFDAVVAAQFAAFAAEPVLTSPGGGGFLFADTGNQQMVYDFFVQTPLSKADPISLDFYPIEADFGEATQEYHIGAGSIATPGAIRGLFDMHRELCSMPIGRLTEPAIEVARNGVEMNLFQSSIFDIIRPIYRSSTEAMEIFGSRASPGHLIREGERLKQPELADFLEDLVREGDRLFYDGEIAEKVARLSRERGGHITRRDFSEYQTIKRKPLQIGYRGHQIAINPPPATGGMLVSFGLKLMETIVKKQADFGSRDYISFLMEVQHMTESARVDAMARKDSENESGGLGDILDEAMLKLYKKEILNRLPGFRGTTQISVIDAKGNKASLTSSNGEGSGVMVPGAGIMMNNMLGEQDLNAAGFHNWEPGTRLSSMMAPGMMTMEDGRNIVFGSGGSNRIRTAILQVLLNLADHGMSLEEAVNAPRMHFEAGKLNAEIGLDVNAFEGLKDRCRDQKIWKEKSLFFGGAHSVSDGPAGFSGAGDVRRGGKAEVVYSQS